MIRVASIGSFKKTLSFLDRLQNGDIYRGLEPLGQKGVRALASQTPIRSGETANSWTYGIERSRGGFTIFWDNTNVNQGQKIAILIQYGHGTGTGGYVQGFDYINPAIRPVFDEIAREVWKKVTDA